MYKNRQKRTPGSQGYQTNKDTNQTKITDKQGYQTNKIPDKQG